MAKSKLGEFQDAWKEAQAQKTCPGLGSVTESKPKELAYHDAWRQNQAAKSCPGVALGLSR